MRAFILAILSLCILSASAVDLDVNQLVVNGNPTVIHNGVKNKTKKAKEISYLVTDGTGQELIMQVESPELKALKITKIKSARGRLVIPDSVEIGNETYAVVNLYTKLLAKSYEVRLPNTLTKIRTSSSYNYFKLAAMPLPISLKDIGKSSFIKELAIGLYTIASAKLNENITVGTRFRTMLDCSNLKYISNSGKLVDFDAFLSKHVRNDNWEEESLKYFIQKFNSEADGQLICRDINAKEHPNYKYYMIIKPILIDSSGRIWANIYISPIKNINKPQFVMAFTAAGDYDDAIALRDPLKEAGEKIAKLILKSM